MARTAMVQARIEPELKSKEANKGTRKAIAETRKAKGKKFHSPKTLFAKLDK